MRLRALDQQRQSAGELIAGVQPQPHQLFVELDEPGFEVHGYSPEPPRQEPLLTERQWKTETTAVDMAVTASTTVMITYLFSRLALRA